MRRYVRRRIDGRDDIGIGPAVAAEDGDGVCSDRTMASEMKEAEVNEALVRMGTRVDATEIFAIGTIKDEYLGLLQPS